MDMDALEAWVEAALRRRDAAAQLAWEARFLVAGRHGSYGDATRSRRARARDKARRQGRIVRELRWIR